MISAKLIKPKTDFFPDWSRKESWYFQVLKYLNQS